MTSTFARTVFTAMLATETNTFAPIPTGAAAFMDGMIRRDASLAEPKGRGAGLHTFRTLAHEQGWAVIESITATAQPAGPTVQTAYESLRKMVIDDLRAAGPVGMVLLALHGAMIATHCDDCEGDILAHVRGIVGPNVPIGVELDPHCHLTDKMLANADVIVIMKEYPHTDWNERAHELYQLCAAQAEGTIKPVAAMFDCRMVGFFPTTVPPMAGFVQLLKQAEQEPGILSVSLAHGFPWGDQAEAGTRVLVVADGDLALAQAVAERLGRALYALRDELLPVMPEIDAALASASRLPGLIVMADTADNPGGGAPGDTTHLLRGLLEAEIGPSVFGAVCDPGAVQICQEAGVGAQLPLRIGGKLGVTSGSPLDVDVEVKALVAEHHQTAFGSKTPLGASAWVRIGEVDVVLTSLRSQIYGRDAFTALGISLEDKRIVAVKSSMHFRADFAAIADHVILVATPGALQMNFAAIPFRRKRDMNFHPRVADPLADRTSAEAFARPLNDTSHTTSSQQA
jgi:microcystin degradation protein MlrC